MCRRAFVDGRPLVGDIEKPRSPFDSNKTNALCNSSPWAKVAAAIDRSSPLQRTCFSLSTVMFNTLDVRHHYSQCAY